MMMLSFFKNFASKIFRFVSPQKIINKDNYSFILKVDRSDVQHIIRSNVVLKIQTEEKHIFFRHCFPQRSLKNYVSFFINYYYEYIANNDIADKAIIKRSLYNGKNFKRFTKMGSWKDKNKPAWRFVENESNVSSVGICYDGGPDFYERIKEFIKFSSVMLDYWKMNHWFGSKSNYSQTYHANYEFAYHQIAKLFGIDDCLPNVWYGFLQIDHELFFGYFMNEAPGVLANSIPKEKRIQLISPAFQKVLSDVTLLDYVCCIHDHAPYNYNLSFNTEGTIDKVFFFDNNEGGGFTIFPRTPKHFSPLFLGNKLNRPFISDKLVDRVFLIRKADVTSALKEYLIQLKIKSVWKRMKKLQTVLRYTKDNCPEKIIGLDKWNRETIIKELDSSEYGRTYLHWFLGVWK